MADADEERFDRVARAEHDAKDFIAVAQEGSRAASSPRFTVSAAQSALGAAEGGLVEQNAQVTRQSEAARMRPTVSVQHPHIRSARQFACCREYGRRLAKRQQPRHIRKPHRPRRDGFLHDVPMNPIPHHDAGHATPTVARKGHVRSGNVPRVRRQRTFDD